MTQPTYHPEQQVILTKDHLPLYGLTLKRVERLMREEGFPPAIRISARGRGWRRHEVEEWFSNRPSGIKPCVGSGQFTPERIEERERKRFETLAAKSNG